MQKAYKWTDSGCQWRPCMLTSELNVNMLIYIVKRARLLSSHPRLDPSFLPSFYPHFRDTQRASVGHAFHDLRPGNECEKQERNIPSNT